MCLRFADHLACLLLLQIEDLSPPETNQEHSDELVALYLGSGSNGLR